MRSTQYMRPGWLTQGAHGMAHGMASMFVPIIPITRIQITSRHQAPHAHVHQRQEQRADA